MSAAPTVRRLVPSVRVTVYVVASFPEYTLRKWRHICDTHTHRILVNIIIDDDTPFSVLEKAWFCFVYEHGRFVQVAERCPGIASFPSFRKTWEHKRLPRGKWSSWKQTNCTGTGGYGPETMHDVAEYIVLHSESASSGTGIGLRFSLVTRFFSARTQTNAAKVFTAHQPLATPWFYVTVHSYIPHSQCLTVSSAGHPLGSLWLTFLSCSAKAFGFYRK